MESSHAEHGLEDFSSNIVFVISNNSITLTFHKNITEVIVHLAKHFGNVVILLIFLAEDRRHVPDHHLPRVLPWWSQMMIDWTESSMCVFDKLPCPPVANLVPSGWMSTEKMGLPVKANTKGENITLTPVIAATLRKENQSKQSILSILTLQAHRILWFTKQEFSFQQEMVANYFIVSMYISYPPNFCKQQKRLLTLSQRPNWRLCVCVCWGCHVYFTCRETTRIRRKLSMSMTDRWKLFSWKRPKRVIR